MLSNSRAITKAVSIYIIVALVVAAFGSYFAYTTLFPPAPKVTEVRIGCPYPLSGSFASQGLESKLMVEWYANEINAKGGVKSLGGAKIKLIFADTESKPEVARIQTVRLITEDKCVALIDGFMSGLVLVESEECEKYQVPILAGSSSSPTLTERGYKYMFRFWASDRMLARDLFTFLKYLEKESGTAVKKIAIINDNTLFGADGGKMHKEANDDPKIGGYEVVEWITIPAGATDLTSEVMRLKKAAPQVLFTIISSASDAVVLQKAMRNHDFNFLALFSSSGHLNPEYVTATGKDGEYVFTRTSYSDDILTVKPHLKYIADKFKELTGKFLYSYPNTSWIALKIAYEAIERAGSLDPKKIRDEIAKTDMPGDDLTLPYKRIKFDETGQNIYATPFINQLLKGSYRLVGPPEVAAVKPVFPQPTWAQRGNQTK